MEIKRQIAKYSGIEKGPLLICLGAVHGNEWAGVKAIDLMGKMLEVEPIANPDFSYTGRFVGFIGNVAALKKNRRFIDVDLNRTLNEATLERIHSLSPDELNSEEREIVELLKAIQKEIEEYNPDRIILLDLHTTSAGGGIFTLTTNDPDSIRIGVELHAPVITGFVETIKGTTMDFFTTNRFSRKITPVVFEGGQHDELLSVNRCIAAITNCMRTIGSVDPKDVENQHDHLLREFSQGLPKVARLIKKYQVGPGEKFIMLPSFKNFQKIHRGQVLAYSQDKPVIAEDDGLIIMPKYQEQGNDGFFIIEPVEGY